MRMIRIVILLLFTMLTFLSNAQEFQVIEPSGINTPNSEIPVYRSKDTLFYFGTGPKDLMHEEDWGADKNYVLKKAVKGNDFSQFDSTAIAWTGFHAFCVNPHDSSLYKLRFGSPLNSMEIEKKDGELISIPLEETIYHICAGSAPNELIVSFHSDESGSVDLALMLINGLTYQLIPLTMVNTAANEIFPSLHQGDLYFSMYESGNFDLYKADGKSQWNEKIKLPTPLNSEKDDLALFFLNEETGFFASNRNGNDNIFMFRIIDNKNMMQLKGELLVKGTALRNVELEVYNGLGELITTVSTDENGKFDLNLLQAEKNYTIKPKYDPRALRSSELSLYDQEGKLVQRIRSNKDGYFIFTLLPYRDSDPLLMVDNPDETSLLTINLDGQLLDEELNPSPEGEPVFLLDESGDAQQVTYTEELGFFHFNNIAPKAKYNIAVPEDLENYAVVMNDAVADTMKFRKTAIVTYQRLDEQDALTLTMPDGEKLEFGEGENLKLRQIDYRFDKWELDEEAKKSLFELAQIWKLNPGITIELQSHTDSRGTDSYNLELSKKRAAEAVKFLISKGISSNALFGKGFGETVLLNGCNDDTECTEEEHAFNRRTEVILHLKRD